MKLFPLATELFVKDERTDGQTEGHNEANNRFSQFCECV
jgi:hypothetical protein